MKNKHNGKSIRLQIILVTLGFAFILAFIVAIVSFIISTNNLKRNQRQSAATSIKMLGREIESDLGKVLLFTNWICYDSSVSSYLQASNDPSISVKQYRSASLSAWNRLTEEYNVLGVRDYIGRAVISTLSGNRYIQSAAISGTTTSKNIPQDLMNSEFFQEYLEAPDFLWKSIYKNPLSQFHNPNILPIVRPIKSTSSSDLLGWVYIEVPVSTLTNWMKNYTLSPDSALYLSFYGSSTGYRYLNKELIQSNLPDGLISYQIPELKLTISVLPSKAEISVKSRNYFIIILLVTAIIMLAGFLMMALLRHTITLPVTALLDRIGHISQGDFSEDRSIEWNNEFGEIGKGINKLSRDITLLMEKKVQNEKERHELEYQILQSQINPHFMYNALNTIKWMATIQGANGISDISTALSRLLKNISKGTETLIPLRDEISLVNDYFTIMKYRYGGTIELDYDIPDPGVLDCIVNRFSLQPILENAIFHGIEPKGGAGNIVIRCWKENHNLFIEVKDDGIGMEPDTIRKVLSGEEESPNEFFRHIGISNVNRRIHYDFGPEYGISISSVPGDYTSMLFTLPALESPERKENHV